VADRPVKSMPCIRCESFKWYLKREYPQMLPSNTT